MMARTATTATTMIINQLRLPPSVEVVPSTSVTNSFVSVMTSLDVLGAMACAMLDVMSAEGWQ